VSQAELARYISALIAHAQVATRERGIDRGHFTDLEHGLHDFEWYSGCAIDGKILYEVCTTKAAYNDVRAALYMLGFESQIIDGDGEYQISWAEDFLTDDQRFDGILAAFKPLQEMCLWVKPGGKAPEPL